jgi:hypothetical protein
MYTAALIAHSWLRWVVLVFAVIAIARSIAGASARRPWNPADDRAGLLFTIALDVQLLLGLLLYFVLSPFTIAALRDFGGAMGNSALRFWAVEHVFGMLVAIILAHVGRARVRKTADGLRKHKVAATFYILSLLALLVSIPWPGMPNGRALVRW